MARHDYNIAVEERDDVSEIGLDNDDLATLEEAENDDSKVVTKVPTRPYQLGYLSVFCIIVNKMIGTGIFDTPSTIMQDTKSVGVTLIFWSLGSIGTIAGTLVFMEYGLTIPRWELNNQKIFTPRSGGEFNYINYLIKRPKFFASCFYGIPFILIGNAAANALSFASHVVTASGGNVTSSTHDRNLVRAIAIGTMTAVCLLHGIWRRAGIAINNLFAVFKLLLLLLIIILGFIALGGTKTFKVKPPASENLSPSKSFKNKSSVTYAYASAYLDIVFAYGGFNQANYVLGEVKNPRKIFRSATLLAVSTVCVSYMLVNIAYMIVVPAAEQINGNVSEQFIALTLGQTTTFAKSHAKEIINAFMAFSSLGNIIVSTYTAARVKQEIAKEGILPFSKLIARNYDILPRVTSCFRGRTSQHKLANAQDSVFHEKTPFGALLVHWFFSMIIISCTWKVAPKTAYTIVLYIYSYTIDAFMAVVIGVGLLYLRFAASRTHWHLKSRSNGIVSVIAAFLFVTSNIFPVVALWTKPSADFPLPYRPWKLVPAIAVGLLGSGVVYWALFVGVAPRLGGNRGKELIVQRSPFFHTEHGEPVQVAEVVSFDWMIKERQLD